LMMSALMQVCYFKTITFSSLIPASFHFLAVVASFTAHSQRSFQPSSTPMELKKRFLGIRKPQTSKPKPSISTSRTRIHRSILLLNINQKQHLAWDLTLSPLSPLSFFLPFLESLELNRKYYLQTGRRSSLSEY